MKLILALAIILSLAGCTETSSTLAAAEITHFAFEGDTVPIKVTIDGEAPGEVTLEEYEFHYIMHPELAPEPDTWSHNAQMGYMRDVLEGTTAKYVPSLKDEKVKKILETSPKKEHPMQKSVDGTYKLDWNASHGRIFFRITSDGEYTGDLYTTRVHCRHVDMRSFERLKDTLEAMALPIEHKNTMMVENVFEGAFSIYTTGHSPRFMLAHHEYPVDDLDALFDSLKKKIEEEDLEGAEGLRKGIMEKLTEKEDLFYELDTDTEDDVLTVTIHDKINDFSFYDDPNTEAYLKAVDKEEEALDMMAGLHGGQVEHDHSKMNAPLDLEKLLDGALPFSKKEGKYRIEPDEGFSENLKIIVIYGDGQRYYLTRSL